MIKYRDHAVLVLAVLLCPVWGIAQDKKPETARIDPSGTWHWTHEEGGETVKSVLTINYDGKEVSGRYRGRVEKTIEAAKLDGEKLTFKFDIDVDGQKIGIQFEGVVKKEDLEGKVVVLIGGETQQYPWMAKRTLETEDVVGTWNIKIVTDDGTTIEPALKLTKQGEALQGTYTSKGLEQEFPAKELKLNGQQLSFVVSGEVNGRKFQAKYSGQPRGDKMAGTVDYDLDGNTGSIGYVASRAVAKAAASGTK